MSLRELRVSSPLAFSHPRTWTGRREREREREGGREGEREKEAVSDIQLLVTSFHQITLSSITKCMSAYWLLIQSMLVEKNVKIYECVQGDRVWREREEGTRGREGEKGEREERGREWRKKMRVMHKVRPKEDFNAYNRERRRKSPTEKVYSQKRVRSKKRNTFCRAFSNTLSSRVCSRTARLSLHMSSIWVCLLLTLSRSRRITVTALILSGVMADVPPSSLPWWHGDTIAEYITRTWWLVSEVSPPSRLK